MPLTRKTPPRLVSLALPLVAILLAGCAAFYPPQDVTSEGAATRNLYDIVFIIAAVIFFAVEGAIIWIVLRYRRKPTDTELPSQFHGNNLIELIWTIIPTVIVLYMFVISWQTLQTVEAKDPNPAVRVVANAQRFAWSFGYQDANGQPLVTNPDGSPYVFYGTLEVPPGAPVHVLLRSPDVIHAFYVPKFLFKRDVVPHQDNNFDFNVDPGDAGQTFHGQCAELCGVGHGTMTFDVHAQASLAAFQAWLAGIGRLPLRGAGPARRRARRQRPAAGECTAGQRRTCQRPAGKWPSAERTSAERRTGERRHDPDLCGEHRVQHRNARGPGRDPLQHRVREQRQRPAPQRRHPRRERRRRLQRRAS